ncbi:hypothetical protein AB0I28_27030 [Phytomonospora sp. NPDC050363]|uniref:hypothetical protein n=1 Tax=Phytomonospora sp. NPDC050363 TaxID=3155642 RepID=UPI00340C5702
MRHILSLIYGLFGALAAWLAAAIGANAFLFHAMEAAGAPLPDGTWAKTKLIGYAGVALAGVILGFLATLRLSPAGPILAAVILIGGQVIFEYKASWLEFKALTDGLKLDPSALTLPSATYAPVIVAAILLTAAFSFSRWRNPKAVTADNTGYAPTEAPLGSAALNDSFGQQPIDPFAPAAPTYEPAPAAPAQPSMYVDDGEGATTQLPSSNPHQQKPPPPPYGS